MKLSEKYLKKFDTIEFGFVPLNKVKFYGKILKLETELEIIALSKAMTEHLNQEERNEYFDLHEENIIKELDKIENNK